MIPAKARTPALLLLLAAQGRAGLLPVLVRRGLPRILCGGARAKTC